MRVILCEQQQEEHGFGFEGEDLDGKMTKTTTEDTKKSPFL